MSGYQRGICTFIFSQTKLTSTPQLVGQEIINSLQVVGNENVLSHEKIIDDPHRKICLWKFDHHLILKKNTIFELHPSTLFLRARLKQLDGPDQANENFSFFL